MKPKLLITYNIFGELYREILKEFEVTMPAPGVDSFTYDEVLDVIGDRRRTTRDGAVCCNKHR